jgi:hypothetical protein
VSHTHTLAPTFTPTPTPTPTPTQPLVASWPLKSLLPLSPLSSSLARPHPLVSLSDLNRFGLECTSSQSEGDPRELPEPHLWLNQKRRPRPPTRTPGPQEDAADLLRKEGVSLSLSVSPPPSLLPPSTPFLLLRFSFAYFPTQSHLLTQSHLHTLALAVESRSPPPPVSQT